MPKSTLEDDISDLIEDCDTIIELLKKKRVGGTISDTGSNTWPEIKLDDDDISFLTDTLEKNGKNVAKIRIFADKLGNDFPQIAQQIVDSHARLLFTATAMEQGRVHQIDFGKIWNQVDVLKKNLLNFESVYRIQKSYNSVKYDYDKITPESSDGIHWGKLGIIIAIGLFIAGSIVTILVSQYYFDLQKHDQQLVNSTLVKTIAQQTTIETYDKDQPFSLQWTDCIAPDPGDNLNGESRNSTLVLKPVLLDREGYPATIKFNTSYFFSASDVWNTYPKKLHPISPITMHILDPSDRTPVFLNLTNTFNEAKQLGIYQIRITLTQSSVAPYSDTLGKNLVDYTNDRSERVVTQFMYLYVDNQHKWIEVHDVESSICNNLVKK